MIAFLQDSARPQTSHKERHGGPQTCREERKPKTVKRQDNHQHHQTGSQEVLREWRRNVSQEYKSQ